VNGVAADVGRSRTWIFAPALLALLLGWSAVAGAQPDMPPAAQRETETRQQLAALRDEIRALTTTQTALDGERNATARELREADHALAAAASTLRATEEELAVQIERLRELEAQRAAVAAGLEEQRAMLASLLRSAHALGRHHQLKLLLSHSDGARIGRSLAYQRYFQRERMRQIESLLAQLLELAEAQRNVDAQQQRLSAARIEQQQAATQLGVERDAQRARLEAINAQFVDGKARLVALGRDEAGLLRLLESLKDVFADIPKQLAAAGAFAGQRGRLVRPLAGRTLASFGGRLPDGRPSSGWLIGATVGTPVRAVAHGRVAFAEWLKGYGLLLIVDHGEGYMSLYAGNESVQKDIGDWVQAGDVVASAGSSGGQPQSGLYFELRRNGRPIDPKGWLSP
jgi:murein hydrolase activator